MMKSLGHTVYHYGVGCDVECDEDIIVMDAVEMDWSGASPFWKIYNERIIHSINLRKSPRDFVCVINGHLNQMLEQIAGVQVVEYAIGYNGTFAKYRVFASNAHMHKVWGAEGGLDPDGKWYDTVIPHYLDVNEYPVGPCKRDYFLYIGRQDTRKGFQIAIDTCKLLGVKLKIAGGTKVYQDGLIEYVGTVVGEQRLNLYQNAIATFCPTIYIEPFNMTAIESQMLGTPVITSHFGAFTENVRHGIDGFNCRTLNQFVHATKSAEFLDNQSIRLHAINTWGIDTIRHQYQEYFESLTDLWDGGWSTLHEST